MRETRGKDVLFRLRKRWLYKALLSQFLLALAITVFIFVLLYKIFLLPLYWGFPCLIGLFIIINIFYKSRRLNEWDVSRFLNSTNPLLEESAHLFLKPPDSLTLLEKLQVSKIEHELLSRKAPGPFKKNFNTSLIVLLIASAASIVLFKIPFNRNLLTRPVTAKPGSFSSRLPERLLPEIKNAIITITPPLYTRKSFRQQSSFNLVAEEGAFVLWQIQTNVPAKQVALIFNDGKTLQLTVDVNHVEWKAQKPIITPGFYQVKVNNKLSELYRIETIKDQPPTITVQSPGQNTFINYGMPGRVMVKVKLEDDYGITTAGILATISSGEGEAVKFKEKKFVFENFAPGNKEYSLQSLIDCKALDMQPGDELYFFTNAMDNHDQQTRSEVYAIIYQDTTASMSMDGMVTGLDIKPELFRSERQIIIETEQLLKDRVTIGESAFRQKSNDLGVDQKLLRLRYGKFLGDETDAGTGEAEEYKNDYGNRANTNNQDEILKKYGHEHDNAEDATFFDPATKKQLKEMLTEMWNAELKLRTVIPKEALPFEHKALLLLKDLQQNSRAYVPKTGSRTSPLDLNKRLTGDLSKISEPVMQEAFVASEPPATIARRALGTLEQLKDNGNLTAAPKQILQQAFQQLSIRAANEPAVYLVSLSALRKILNENYSVKDIDNAEEGLQKMSPAAERLPFSAGNVSMDLSKQYFININKSGHQ